MSKRTLLVGGLAVVSMLSASRPARAEATSALGRALEGCVPGARFSECTHGLRATHAEVTIPIADDVPGAVVKLPAPFDHASVRRDGGDGVAATVLTMSLVEGKRRQSLVGWVSTHTKNAPTSRGASKGSASICGASGWGVAWSSSAGVEVQVQLDDPKSVEGQNPSAMSPNDAVVNPHGNGKVAFCFLMPGQPAVKPVFAAGVMSEFIESIPGLGTTAERDSKSPEQIAKDMQEGIQLYKAGKYSAAVDSLMTAKRGTVGIPELYYWLALSHEKLGKSHQPEFLAAMNESLRGKYAPAELAFADYWWDQGNKTNALFHYQRYLELHGSDASGTTRAQTRLAAEGQKIPASSAPRPQRASASAQPSLSIVR